MNIRLIRKGLGMLLLAWGSLASAGPKVTVYAAASLTDAVGEIAAKYEAEKAVKVAGSYAASSALARQIEQGAPADVFVSADLKWMDYLHQMGRIMAKTRVNLLGNRLVVVAPKGRGFKIDPVKGFDFAKVFAGRLCTGDLESVPAGIYAKQSLRALGWWDAIKSRIVGSQDVRAALAFVERGECAAGIVYETDARMSGRVELVGVLPQESHDAIVYPVAAVAGSNPEGRAFVKYLASPAAGAVFEKYGFTLIGK